MKVRVKFSKYGPVKFVGHLDIMHYFQKALRRAGIDIAYSEGFSPHQIMSFASPLSVGHTSEGEYFDMEVNSFTDETDMLQKLNQVMVEGIEVLKVRFLDKGEGNAMASVAAAAYLVAFSDKLFLPENWDKELITFYRQEHIPVIKKTKKGQKEIDLKESIYQLEVRGDNCGNCKDRVYMLVDAGSGSNIKPEFVMETFLGQINVQLPEHPFRIHRIETYKRAEDGQLVPLIAGRHV